ncbi:MAG: response regulator transcription factor [Nitrospina sp.]|nr:response regulator transcription factor [Nitrospina sp.]MBT6718420.1 response regulator transcription factor [Nitrospina sp.]
MKKDTIKVLIVDDHTVVREGLKEILSQTPDLILVGEARSGSEALVQARNTNPDVVLLDVGLPDKNGLEVIKDLKSEFPDMVVLVLSMYPEDRFEKRFLKAGASGYLTKASDSEQLITAIRKVSHGGKLVSPYLAEKLAFDLEQDPSKSPHELLSDREYQVMCLIASGISLTEIAKNLSLSINTISTYRTRILNKVNVENNIQLTHYVLENKLLE